MYNFFRSINLKISTIIINSIIIKKIKIILFFNININIHIQII